MAKKKTKTVEKKETALLTAKDCAKIVEAILLAKDIDIGTKLKVLNQRIDRIVEAHEKCKSLKNL